MKLMWLGYLIYSLGNYAMKLYIETGLTSIDTNCYASSKHDFDHFTRIYNWSIVIKYFCLHNSFREKLYEASADQIPNIARGQQQIISYKREKVFEKLL